MGKEVSVAECDRIVERIAYWWRRLRPSGLDASVDVRLKADDRLPSSSVIVTACMGSTNYQMVYCVDAVEMFTEARIARCAGMGWADFARGPRLAREGWQELPAPKVVVFYSPSK